MKKKYKISGVFVGFAVLIIGLCMEKGSQSNFNIRMEREETVSIGAGSKEGDMGSEVSSVQKRAFQNNSGITSSSELNTIAAFRIDDGVLYEFYLAEAPSSQKEYLLEYDLQGLSDYTALSRSVNDELSVGGYTPVISEEQTKQSQRIQASLLKEGANRVRFAIQKPGEYPYKISNLRIVIQPKRDKAKRTLVINQPSNSYYFQNLGYIQGYVSGEGSEQATVKIEGSTVRKSKYEFEAMIRKPDQSGREWSQKVCAIFPDGEVLCTEVHFQRPSESLLLGELENSIYTVEKEVESGQELSLQLCGVSLEVDSASISKSQKFSITALRSQDFPFLQQGMLNMTAGLGKGYRMLPHGRHFSKPATIGISYDKTALPQGYTADDIFTYYYDEGRQSWQFLERLEVDTLNQVIYSSTTHFTDFVNAILKQPEMPETQAFVPTSLKDFETPNPIEGIQLMSAPSPNNMGTANLSYPIEIPMGRSGMQPQLALN